MPYPDLVSKVKGVQISIYSFMPHWQLQVLNRHHKSVVIHLPRIGRIADPDNIRELLEMRQKYPDIQIVIAHFGRSFNPVYLKIALKEMGKDGNGFYHDTAAVLNPAVYELAWKTQVILNTIDRLGLGEEMKRDLFYGNAAQRLRYGSEGGRVAQTELSKDLRRRESKMEVFWCIPSTQPAVS